MEYKRIRTRRKYNKITCDRNICSLEIEKNGKISKYIFDKKFLEKVENFTWYSDYYGYLTSRFEVNKKKHIIRLHNLVTGYSKGMDVDHIDRDIKNNLLSNLRIVSHIDNLRNAKLSKSNKSGYKGVYRNSWGKWTAQIKVNYKMKNLGSFHTPYEAHLCRLKAELKYWGKVYSIV